MRGAPYDGIPGKLQGRIIPADAGSTQWSGPGWHDWEDHPRGCGEHLWDVSDDGLWLRIIPADAGSTPVDVPGDVFREDHPRGCGEHFPWSYLLHL